MPPPELAVSVTLNIAPVDTPAIVVAAESDTYTLPDVFAIRFGALVTIFAPVVPIAPLPENNVNVPVVDIFVEAN